MRKACDQHGPFEDVLSIDPAFSKRMNALHPGKDLPCGEDLVWPTTMGPSSTKVGYGGIS